MDDAARPDEATLSLLGLAAAIAVGDPEKLRAAVGAVLAASVPLEWVDELVLQSVLWAAGKPAEVKLPGK